MENKKYGFTLAEALVALLIASLLIAAMIPVLTKKHRNVEVHGKWECSYRNGTVARTYTNGVPDEWKSSDCMFSPPAGAENFRVTVIGGGGGGAGGTGGRFDNVLSEKKNGAYVLNAARDGTYFISLQGGGGAGGGMGCGSPENIDYGATIDNYFPHQYSGSGTISNPGTVDLKDTSFNYNVLYSNTLSDISPYLQDASHSYCFTRSGWKEWDFTNAENCWNWPGQGAYAGGQAQGTVKLKRGQSLLIYIGKGGSAGTDMLNGQVVGSSGASGEASYSSLGVSAAGALPGNYRYKTYVSYKDVPVINCKNVVVDKQRTEIETINHNCDPENNDFSVDGTGSSSWCTTDTCKAACPNLNSACSMTGTAPYTWCRGTYTEEKSKIVNYQVVEIDETTCERVYRRINSWLPACTSSLSGSGPSASLSANAEEPQLINTTVETDADGESETIAGAGSGGWGAGPHIHVNEAGEKSYLAEDGIDGSAEVHLTDFSGGGGGEAGRLVTSVFKKLPRVQAIPGRGGAGSDADSKANGQNGGDSSLGSLLFAQGGRGGKSQAIKSGIILKGHNLAYFPGGNGGYAPLYANINGHGDCAYGGRNSGRNSNDGMNAVTPLFSAVNETNKLMVQAYLLFFKMGTMMPWNIPFFGGSEGDLTYGAGGGGGAGGGVQGNIWMHSIGLAGKGGSGAPGVIIIEW